MSQTMLKAQVQKNQKAKVQQMQQKIDHLTSLVAKNKPQGKKPRKRIDKKKQKKNLKVVATASVNQVIPKAWSTSQKTVFNVKVTFEKNSLRWALASLASYMCQNGSVNNVTSSGTTLPWDDVYSGLSYLSRSIGSIIQGGTLAVNSYPAVINDLIWALKGKTARFHGDAFINYIWDSFEADSGLDIGAGFAVGDGTWAPTFVIVSGNAYDAPANLAGAIASEGSYTGLQKLMTAANYTNALRIVKEGSPSLLKKDTSTFARAYKYNGLQPNGVPAGGYWIDLENEAAIKAPMYAKFVNYDQPDVRVPKKLCAYSGDAQQVIGLPLTQLYRGPFNFVPPTHKLIDFEEIYTTLSLWMCRAKEAAQVNSAIPLADNIAAQPFNFSAQDARILIRQVCMLIYGDSQFFVQSMGPVAQDDDNNNFVPFQVMGSTFGAPQFGKFRMPELIVENLAAMKIKGIDIPGKSKYQHAIVIPVLGRYWADTPVNPQYKLGNVMVDLYATLPQTTIRMTDGWHSASNKYVDLNGPYYQGVLNDWNFNALELQNVTVSQMPALTDHGPDGLGILYFTRIQNHITGEQKSVAPIPRPYQTQNLRWCVNTNTVRREVKEVKSKRSSKKECPCAETLFCGYVKDEETGKRVVDPEIIPAASIMDLSIGATLNRRRLQLEEEGLFDTLITPSVRLNLTEDALTAPMYIIETDEACNEFFSNAATAAGTGMYGICADLAGMCVTGLGKDNADSYARILGALRDEGRAGMLANLLAPLVSSIIPGSESVVKEIAKWVPF